MSDSNSATGLHIHETAWLAPTAQAFGEVAIGAGSSVWHNAVLRAECVAIRIGRMTNIQDFVMVHVGFDYPTVIGDFCSITHHATVHGAVVGDDCLIGINAVLMDGVVVGRGSIVAGNSLLREGSVFPPGSIIAGTPAKVVRERDSSRPNRLNAWQYRRNADFFRIGRHDAWRGEDYLRWLAEITRAVESDEDLEGFPR
jgi:carbonic anhydrase/acetyltransferase-like protein (isoleucine patch superfamily)